MRGAPEHDEIKHDEAAPSLIVCWKTKAVNACVHGEPTPVHGRLRARRL